MLILKYIFKKIFYIFLIFSVVFVAIFITIRKFSDPATALLGHKSTHEQIIKLRQELGLDQPLSKQLKKYIIQIFFHFDFGNSYINKDTKVLKLFLPAFLITLKISLISCFFSSLIGILLGLISAFYRDSKKDYFLIFVSILIISIPNFVISFLVQYFLGFRLNIFPISGTDQPFSLVLPIFSLVLMSTFLIFRIARTNIIRVLEQPFILTARAKGLPEYNILLKHALKNAIIPIITNIGLIFSYMLSGSIITENIFDVKGLGYLIMNSFQNRDFPVIQCAIIMLSLAIGLFNIFLEFLYYLLDPKVKNK
jgi:peptide/nickel transport system permease protein